MIFYVILLSSQHLTSVSYYLSFSSLNSSSFLFFLLFHSYSINFINFINFTFLSIYYITPGTLVDMTTSTSIGGDSKPSTSTSNSTMVAMTPRLFAIRGMFHLLLIICLISHISHPTIDVLNITICFLSYDYHLFTIYSYLFIFLYPPPPHHRITLIIKSSSTCM